MIYEKEMYHFLILHFPIALFFTAYVLDIVGYIKSDSLVQRFSYWNLIMGLFWGVLSIVSGFITDQDIGHMNSPFPVWTTHGTHMIIAVALFLLIIIIKYLNKEEKLHIPEKFILFIHTLVIMFFIHGAHIGARLADRL